MELHVREVGLQKNVAGIYGRHRIFRLTERVGILDATTILSMLCRFRKEARQKFSEENI